MKKKINVAVMAGGNSSEYEVSVGSAGQVIGTLDRDKYTPYLINVRGSRWFHTDEKGEETVVDKNDFSLTIGGQKIGLDYALIMIHGTPGEDGQLQAYFEMLSIPFSSSGFLTSAITFSKSLCKRAVAHTGLPMAREIVIGKGETVEVDLIIETLGLPLFVKPDASGSSFGVTKVKKPDDLLPAVEAARKESRQVIIEEFLSGTEVDCGMMVYQGEDIIFPPTEIVSMNEFFDYEAKYTPGKAQEITPAWISREQILKVQQATRTVYHALNCRGVIRADFMIVNGDPHLIEVNTVPGMSEGSIVPKEVKTMGWTLGQLIDRVIEETYTA